jgi:branched-chain amino acid transport system permease protein
VDLVGLIGFNVLVAIATLVLLAIGLGVIYGMMRIINLAHGEFLMLGAYATALATNHGVNIWVSMLVISPIFVGIFGLLVERLFIRFLYGRMIGTTVQGVSAPLGGFAIGRYQGSLYGVFLVIMAVVVLAGLLALLRYTKFGLIVRATMQNPRMAAGLGVSPPFIYMATFALGAALTGLAGGLLAPVSGTSPTMGIAFVAESFITVLGGGAAFVTGTGIAGSLFGVIDEIGTVMTTPVFGEVALLLSAVVLIRVLPQGITGRFFRRSV